MELFNKILKKSEYIDFRDVEAFELECIRTIENPRLHVVPEYHCNGNSKFIHVEEGVEDHVVVKGKNPLRSVMYARRGNGTFKEIPPGGGFKSHLIVRYNF